MKLHAASSACSCTLGTHQHAAEPLHAHASAPQEAACSLMQLHVQSRGAISSVAWTPEGRRCLTGTNNGEFTLWHGNTFHYETQLQVSCLPPPPPPPLLQRQHVCTQQCDACQSMLCICLCCLLCTHASENSRCHILCPSVAMVSGSRHLQQHLPAAHLQLTAMQQLVSITLGCATDCLLKIDS